MRSFVLLGVPTPLVLVLAQAAGGDIDFTAYGIAAPFAALCLAVMWRIWKLRETERAEYRAALADKDDEIRQLHAAALKREQDLLAGLAPRLYDSALLYREGNRVQAEVARAAPLPATVDPENRLLKEVLAKVDALIRQQGDGSP